MFQAFFEKKFKNNYPLVDSHCHLDLCNKSNQLNNIIKKSESKHVKFFVLPGINSDNWIEILNIAAHYPNVFFALGIHPYFIQCEVDAQNQFNQLQNMLEATDFIASQQQFIAIGEIGIDSSRSDIKLQSLIFKQQLLLAQKLALPVIIHHRNSIDLICQLVRQTNFSHGGVVHAFSGSQQQADNLIALGFKLGVGGVITYPRASKTRRVIQSVSLASLLIETDSPDMPLAGYQGQDNHPSQAVLVFKALCELRQEPPEVIQQALWHNVKACFPRFLVSL
ncbi:TatD family hydrolase [Catenovulum maritimum]|uniref:Hydrolase TatD n=1 Tax=Catenovulum maritimum TaxID=1513271 RepID=A0A0J8GLY1_9ALTE|nr:TatD family hydrolase [Catenovulum maritimum]KMT63832.1 hypothetical protein XM47_17635 [Catenovulum maritimum]